MMLGAFGEKIRIVNTLGARYNFLTSHEHVVRIGRFLQCKIYYQEGKEDTILYVRIYRNTLQDYLDPASCKKVLQPEDICLRYKNLCRTERKNRKHYICNMKRSSIYA